jgi:CrcB protein
VAAGGAAGSVLRLLLGTAIQQRAGGEFPPGTVLINITGSLSLGFLLESALSTPAISREGALVTTGFCSGYRTIATFRYETIKLLQDGDYRHAGTSIGLSVIGCLLGGFGSAREILTLRRLIQQHGLADARHGFEGERTPLRIQIGARDKHHGQPKGEDPGHPP